MALDKDSKIKKINIALWSLALLLLLGLLFFIKCSLNIISETSKNNFAYTAKVRNSIEEVDKIVERAQLNIDVFTDFVELSYQADKLYNGDYNKKYLTDIDLLVKSILANSPGVDGSWFQLNANVPFSNEAFIWYGIKNNKIVNLKSKLSSAAKERKLNPQDDPYYFDALNNKGTTWSEIYIDSDINVPMITISKPIYIHNTLIGVVGIDISINSIKQAMSDMQKNFDGSEIYLLNEKNEILISKSASKVFLVKKRNISDVLNIKNNNADMIEYSDNGISKTAIFLNLSNRYHILITFKNLVIYKGYDQLFKIIYFIFFMVVILTVCLFVNRHSIIEANKKLAKERNTLRTIIDSSPNVIIIKDLDGKLLDFNNKFLEATGLSRENLLGKTAKDLFDKEKVFEIQENTNIVKKFHKVVSHETYYHNAKGENKCVEEYIIPSFDLNGNLNGFIVVAFDLSKQKQIQENLKKAKEKTDILNFKYKGFIVNMSHELRTPLDKILNLMALLKKTKINKEQADILQSTHIEFQKLIKTVNQIISLSKV